ncbi:MAG: hypothetical protein AAGU27_28305 [Dehalobacterium sp.]
MRGKIYSLTRTLKNADSFYQPYRDRKYRSCWDRLERTFMHGGKSTTTRYHPSYPGSGVK